MDLHMLITIFPAGVALCYKELRDEHVFVIIYAVVASYFAGVMVRLILALTPVVCVAAAIAISSLLDTYVDAKTPELPDKTPQSSDEPPVASGTPASSSDPTARVTSLT